MQVTTEDPAHITQDLDLPTSTPQHVDLLFVFGTRHLEPARLAADHYRRGNVRRVVLTGGTNRLTGSNEAQAHLEVLLASGVPRDSTIVEDQSTNTLENVTFALPLIARSVDIGETKVVIALTKWYHSRRAVMTLKRFMPGVRFYTATYEPADVPRSGWWLTDEGRQPVLKEWRVIPEYLKQGALAEIQLSDGAYV